MKAVTANRLADGEVVFWKAGAWVEGFGDAELFDESREAEVEAAVATGKAQPTVIVDPYPIDLAPVPGSVGGGLAPVSYRELIRAHGPTNEPTHGKQAVGGEVIEALRHAAGAARSTGRVDLIRRK
jgi:sulfite reductase (NADPH) hemoprotein beta-component